MNNLQLWWRALRARRFRRTAGAHVRALLAEADGLRSAVDPDDFGVGLTVALHDIVATLEAMVARGESAAGLIFSRRLAR